MRIFATGCLLFVVLLLVSAARAQDDDDGDGAYGADDGDDGYDAAADDDGGDDAPADGDDDFGGDESRPQPEYVSTIERDDSNEEEGESTNKVEMRLLPHKRMRRSLDPILSRMERSNRGEGVVGPVHTYVRTDFDGNYRWGARHHVGSSYGRGK